MKSIKPTKMLSFLLLLLMVMVLFPMHSKALDDDYPYKNESYGTYRIPEDVDPWGFYYRECTSFAAWRLNHINGVNFNNYYGGVHFGNAANWGSAALSLGITVDMNPAVGSVAWYNGGTYGHVADLPPFYGPGAMLVNSKF